VGLIKPTQALVLISRGIEWCRDEERWLPCGYIQQAVRSSWPNGDEKRVRTGVRDRRLEEISRGSFSTESQDTWLAGTEMNILAVLGFLTSTCDNGLGLPELLVVSGGRPKYLKEWPSGGAPSEGEVIARGLKGTFEDSPDTIPGEIVVNENGLNTEDDVANALKVAHERELKTITFVNVEVAMPRTIAFWGKVRAEHPEYVEAGIEVRFLTAEQVLESYEDLRREIFHSIDMFGRGRGTDSYTIAWARSSNAWRFTWAQELIGLQKLVEGGYASKGNY
jgi:hypothetical protein